MVGRRAGQRTEGRDSLGRGCRMQNVAPRPARGCQKIKFFWQVAGTGGVGERPPSRLQSRRPARRWPAGGARAWLPRPRATRREPTVSAAPRQAFERATSAPVLPQPAAARVPKSLLVGGLHNLHFWQGVVLQWLRELCSFSVLFPDACVCCASSTRKLHNCQLQ